MYRTFPRPVSSLLLVVGVAAVLAGCRGGGDRVAVSGSTPAPSTTSTSAPPPTVGTTTTAHQASTTTSRRPSTTTTTTAKPMGPPRVVVPQQGDRVVAVFVATGASLDEPSFATARARLGVLGYTGFSGGDTACSRGAKEALPQLKGYSLSLEFATRADADRFAARYGRVIGIAAVNVYCAD